MLKVLFTIWFSIISIWAFAQVPKFSNEFLAIGVGARAHGMARAQVATTNDVSSMYWNPAGLSNITSPFQINAMHAEWFGGVGRYDFIGIGTPLIKSQGVFGVSLIRLGFDNIPNTLNLIDSDGSINYDNISPFTAADYAGMLSYSRQFPRGLKAGINVKVIHRIVGDFANAWGFGLDLGIQYDVKDRLFLGLVGRDLTSTFNAWQINFTDEEKLILGITGNQFDETSIEITSPRFTFGIAYDLIKSKKFKLLPELNFDITTDGRRNVLIQTNVFSIDPFIGLEADYNNMIFLRGGIGNIQKAKDDLDPEKTITTIQPNAGMGVKFGGIRIDYALTDIGDLSQAYYSHIFSLIIDLRYKKEREQVRSKRKLKKLEKKKAEEEKQEKEKEQKPKKPNKIFDQID